MKRDSIKNTKMETSKEQIISDFINFLNASPTPFHAVDEAKKRLKKERYEQISEREEWSNLKVGKKYFFTRNYSTIIAFAIGNKYVAGNGFHIVAAHTDSPALKLKPISKVGKGGYLEVGVQRYGGGLWHTWFDRDLTVAGRVIVKENKGGDSVCFSHRLVRIEDPIMRIPTLAIHLDRDVNDGFKVNTQNHLLPVLATSIKAELNKAAAENSLNESVVDNDGKKSSERANAENKKHHSLLLQLLATQIGCGPDDICDFELQVCDTQPSIVAGAMKEFIFSGRLDNLCMSFCSLKALIDSTSAEGSLEDETGIRMVALFDHEEVGSDSAQGAGSPAMLDALSRITNSFSSSNSKLLEKAVQRSFVVSADMAHALHPNYMDFVVRNDGPCGSTIGPILASGIGIRTVDVGAPQLSMHSIREMCGVDDVRHSYEHFKAYFEEFSELETQITVDF
ncbi:hypothetical protein IFM89_017373 [Coptis chinensis]|uniref:Aspartyl aminopeptidase n=1 Tax=Coptis chinensis TaxID=261450 RepID=A0A835HNB5_9MAGN|nr:hypothetical protein IFM89_017373 [Coptis chinensis]